MTETSVPNKRPILVTGSHRSGSTWVGHMIATSSKVTYIHEPFNPKFEPSIFPVSTPDSERVWFKYINHENDTIYYPLLKSIIESHPIYDWWAELKRARNFNDLRHIRWKFSQLNYIRQTARPLMKDPIALLAADWISSRFDAEVVVLIRHPAAFVDSILRRNWEFDFANFLNQPLLMNDYFNPYKDEFSHLVNQSNFGVETAAILWRVLHEFIIRYQQKNPNWLFYRHEDLSREPLHYFEQIFNSLNLEWEADVVKAIEQSTNANNPTETSDVKSLHLNSIANILNWKKRLTNSEIHLIHDIVEDVASHFYSDEDW